MQTPHSGSITLRLRSAKYHGSSIDTHVNDLFHILSQNQKPAVMILADGRPDYTQAGFVDTLFLLETFQRTEHKVFVRSYLRCSLLSF